MPSVVFQTASKPRPCVPVNLADVGAVAKLVADSFTLIRTRSPTVIPAACAMAGYRGNDGKWRIDVNESAIYLAPPIIEKFQTAFLSFKGRLKRRTDRSEPLYSTFTSPTNAASADRRCSDFATNGFSVSHA